MLALLVTVNVMHSVKTPNGVPSIYRKSHCKLSNWANALLTRLFYIYPFKAQNCRQ